MDKNEALENMNPREEIPNPQWEDIKAMFDVLLEKHVTSTEVVKGRTLKSILISLASCETSEQINAIDLYAKGIASLHDNSEIATVAKEIKDKMNAIQNRHRST